MDRDVDLSRGRQALASRHDPSGRGTRRRPRSSRSSHASPPCDWAFGARRRRADQALQACRSTVKRAAARKRSARASKADKACDRAVRERVTLALGALEAERRDERRLALGRVLAGRLAEHRCGRLDIEDVVTDLEGGAERLTIIAQGRALARASAAQNERRPRPRRRGARRSSSPASARISDSSSESSPRAKRPSAARSSIWPPTMPEAPAARARAATSAMRIVGLGVDPRAITSNAERQQGVARQDGGRLVEGLVHGRSAAAQCRHRPSRADRHAPANSNAGARARSRR